MGEFTSVFTNADGALFTETYNQLNALFATVPGNYAQNLRKMYLLNSNYADLSFLFTIHPGEKTNPHLSSEYLAVLETDNATPYYLNLHNGEVAHTLILGMTGSGKSFLCNFLLTNAQKYRPQTYIFDIGGSFQSLSSLMDGRSDRTCLAGGSFDRQRNLLRNSFTSRGKVLCDFDRPTISALSTVQVTPAMGRVTSPSCRGEPSGMSAYPRPDSTIH